MWILNVRTPENEKRVFLDQDEQESFIIGAAPSSDLYLPFQGIDDEHAVIDLRDGASWIQPLSGAPVMISGRRIRDRHRLEELDRIDIAGVSIEVTRRTPDGMPMEALWVSSLGTVIEQYISVLDDLDLNRLIIMVKRAAITEALTRTSGNIKAAARLLRLSRNGLYHMLQHLGIERDGSRSKGRGASRSR